MSTNVMALSGRDVLLESPLAFDERGLLEEIESRGRFAVASAKAFRKVLLGYFKEHGRKFPWRDTFDPYEILVSEVMLQQTQTERVVPYYLRFLERFPSCHALAEAPQAAVLDAWSGLGYYRRALSLKRAAESVIASGQRFPRSFESLVALPGIGPYTAAALLNFAFETPYPMIETNIRTVYLHLFLPDRERVPDKEISALVEATMDRKDPRSWFYALMDFGALIKRHRGKINHRSSHHSVQSKFEGSRRQKRAKVLKFVVAQQKTTAREVQKALALTGADANELLAELVAEGFLSAKNKKFEVA